MQEAQVQSLGWEDPTCLGATKPMLHNYWAFPLQLLSPVPQLLKPACPRACALHQEKGLHSNQDPVQPKKEKSPLGKSHQGNASQRHREVDNHFTCTKAGHSQISEKITGWKRISENRNPYTLPVGMHNGAKTVGNTLSASSSRP